MEEDDEFGESSASFSSMAEIQQQQIPDGDDDILLIGYSAPNCTPVTEAIKAQGINDLTSWTTVQACFIIVYSMLLVVGFIGNGSVLLMFAQNKRLRSTRNLFLLNLTVTDLLLCLTAIPVTPWYALTKNWKFGALMCRIVPLSSSCAVFVTSWSLMAIAVDKFWHIMDVTRSRFSFRLAGFVTILIWTIPFLINLPYMMSYDLVDGSYYAAKGAVPFCGHFCDELNWNSETDRRLYGCMVLIFQFVIPMTIITYCYWRILRKVQKDMIVQNSQFSGALSDTQRISAANRKKRVNYILIGMVLAFIGCNTPLTALNLAKDFKAEPRFLNLQPYLWPLITHLIAMSAVVWNPFLFFWLTTKEKPIRTGNFGGLATTTSEILTSLASRVHSFRSISGDSNSGSKKTKRRKIKGMNGTTVDAPKVEKKPAAANEKPLVGNIYLSSRNKNNGGLKYSVRVAESCNGGSTTRPLILSEGVRRPTLVNNNETVAIVLVSNENFCSSNNNTESRKSSLRKSFSYTMI